MPSDVSGQLTAIPIPTAIALRVRLQFGAAAQERQHSIGFEREQVLELEILRMLERSSDQADGR